MDLFKRKRPVRKKPSIETFMSGRKKFPVDIKTDYDSYFPEDFITMHTGRFNGYTIIIDNKEEMKHVYGNGFFGKGCLSKRWPNFGEPRDGVPPGLRRRQWLRRLQWDLDKTHTAPSTSTDFSTDLSSSGDEPAEPPKKCMKVTETDGTNKSASKENHCTSLYSVIHGEDSDSSGKKHKRKYRSRLIIKKGACISAEAYLNSMYWEKSMIGEEQPANDELHDVSAPCNKSVCLDKLALESRIDEELPDVSSQSCDSLVIDSSETSTSKNISPKDALAVQSNKESLQSEMPASNNSLATNLPSVKVSLNMNESKSSTTVDRLPVTSLENSAVTASLDKEMFINVFDTPDLCMIEDSGEGKSMGLTEANSTQTIVVPKTNVVSGLDSQKDPADFEIAKMLTEMSTSGFAPEQRLAATMDWGQVTVSGANVSSAGTVIVFPDTDDEGEPTLECSDTSGGLVESLHLLPEEAFFLAWALGVMHVVDVVHNVMSLRSLWAALCSVHPNFVATYSAYHYYRSTGWVVKSGIQFGGHFVLYEHGPGFTHSSYIVRVCSPLDEKSRQTKLVHSLMRAAGSCSKMAVLCSVTWEDGLDFSDPSSLRKVAVTSLVIDRFIPSECREEDD